MSAVKSSDKKIRKNRFGLGRSLGNTTICGMDQFEATLRDILLKSRFDCTQRWKFHRRKIPTSRAELINNQMIGGARN